ncbi:MAG TPA: hypothetical protein VGK22_16310 [Candidatus Angelobacter sp.]|jgi:hypothetical protein
MARECAHHHCNHTYHATAFGVSGELLRPTQKSIAAQAASTLSPGGGRGFARTDNFQLDGIMSFRSAYTEVGGSFDDCHNIHTSFAYSVIEGLDIAGIITADKIVSRVAVYSPDESGAKESSFDITGSHFENLRICGHPINIKLSTHEFHNHDTYAKLDQAVKTRKADHLLFLSGLVKLKDKQLQELEGEYHALNGVAKRVAAWKQETTRKNATAYSCSAAAHLNLPDHVGSDSELQGYGPIICIPKFGVVRLAEIIIQKERRYLNMLRVEMCSSGEGNIHNGNTGGGAGPTTYP